MFIKGLYLLVVLFLISGCSTWEFLTKWYPSDNPIEEGIEQGIKEMSGLDIDITPGSPEVKK